MQRSKAHCLVGIMATMAALSNSAAAGWPSRDDYGHIWSIITPSPSAQYRIEIPDDMIAEFVKGSEVLDSADTAMRYVTYGENIPGIDTPSLQLKCSEPSTTPTGSTIACTSASEAILVSTIHVGIRTDGADSMVHFVLRDAGHLIAEFDEEAKKVKVLNPPVHIEGIASRVIYLDPPQLLRSVDIVSNVRTPEAANLSMYAKPSIQKEYADLEKWRSAKLVGTDAKAHTFTFANPFEQPLGSNGRLTFASPTDPSLSLSVQGCQMEDCSGPTEKWAGPSLPMSPVHGISDSSPTTIIPLDAKHFYRVRLQPAVDQPPVLEVGYLETGLVFNAVGKPPYVLVTSPKPPLRGKIGYGGEHLAARTQTSAVTASLGTYSIFNRAGYSGGTLIGPLAFFAMLFIGFDWALDWRVGLRVGQWLSRKSRSG